MCHFQQIMNSLCVDCQVQLLQFDRIPVWDRWSTEEPATGPVPGPRLINNSINDSKYKCIVACFQLTLLNDQWNLNKTFSKSNEIGAFTNRTKHTVYILMIERSDSEALTRIRGSRSPNLLWNLCHQSISLSQPTAKREKRVLFWIENWARSHFLTLLSSNQPWVRCSEVPKRCRLHTESRSG